MSLTNTQLLALKAAILAETGPAFVALRTAGSTGLMAEWLNGASTIVVWRNQTDVATLFDSIQWAKLTPSDTPDGTATYTNRALMCQAKQINLQILLQGQQSLKTSQANIRAGLQDALTAVPSGVGGVTQAAGWLAVQTAMQRPATRGEKVFVTGGAGTSANPSTLTFEGYLSDYDVVQATTQV